MADAHYQVPAPINEPILSYRKGSPERQGLKDKLAELKKNCLQIPLLIGEQKISTTQTEAIYIPHAKNHAIARGSVCTAEHVNAAIEGACKTRKMWAAMPWAERAGIFLKAADLLSTKYRHEMNAWTVLAQSKTCFQAEIDAACELIDFFRFNAYFAEKIYNEQPFSMSGQWNRLTARPLEGFVFAIGPFNFSSISVNLATAPALMGCAVILKPSLQALPATYFALSILEEAGLPPGVINLLSGDPVMIGDMILAHPELAGVHFTGSTQVFQHLWKKTASHLETYRQYPRLVGETGGKDFVLAHPSASALELQAGLIRGAFEYQGQKCSAASRAYIPRSIWDKMQPGFVEEVKAIKMGDPEDFTNFMSAVIDERAFKKITGYIDRAKKSSKAKIICGGEYDDQTGYFIRPTVILVDDPHYETMVEEIFGPVLSIYVYEDKDFDQIVSLVDTSTAYGLTGAIFARDRRVIHDLSERLLYAAGNLYINDKPTGAVVGQQPFGGARRSGTNDKAGSMYNLLRWVSHRTVKENLLSITDYRYPFMDC